MDKKITVVKICRLGVECRGKKVEMEKISFGFGIRVVFEMLLCVDFFAVVTSGTFSYEILIIMLTQLRNFIVF
jgi:hypothetical protein